MNLLTPAIALLKPLSGRVRFWILPLPLLAVVLITIVTLLTHDADSYVEYGGLVALLVGALLLWLYLQLAFFTITRQERDRTESAMRSAAQGNLTRTVNVGVQTLGNFSKHLDKMIVSMSSIVANIRTAAVLVGDTASAWWTTPVRWPSGRRPKVSTCSRPQCTSNGSAKPWRATRRRRKRSA